MKNILKFIFFIISIIGIFFVSNFIYLTAILLLCLLIVVFYKNKTSIKMPVKFLIAFIAFTIIINTIIEGYLYAILIGIRLIIAYLMTYIFSKSITILELSEVIQMLMYPLKIFKINIKNISIMVCIAICMLPILQEQITEIKYSLKAKGCKLRINNISVFMKPLLISVLKRTDEMEKTLISRGYAE